MQALQLHPTQYGAHARRGASSAVRNTDQFTGWQKVWILASLVTASWIIVGCAALALTRFATGS